MSKHLQRLIEDIDKTLSEKKDCKYKAQVGDFWLQKDCNRGWSVCDDKDEADEFESETEPRQIINQMKRDGKLKKDTKFKIQKIEEDQNMFETQLDMLSDVIQEAEQASTSKANSFLGCDFQNEDDNLLDEAIELYTDEDGKLKAAAVVNGMKSNFTNGKKDKYELMNKARPLTAADKDVARSVVRYLASKGKKDYITKEFNTNPRPDITFKNDSVVITPDNGQKSFEISDSELDKFTDDDE